MKRKRYARKFQSMAVERLRTCDDVGELARELGVNPAMPLPVAQQTGSDRTGDEASRASTHTAAYRREIQQLKRLLAEKPMEVDFFKGAY